MRGDGRTVPINEWLLPQIQAVADLAQPDNWTPVENSVRRIDDVHRAIRSGQITCQGLLEAYLSRAKAYNGVSNALVTKDGAPIPEAPGVVRAGAPLKFPTTTVKASTVLPNLEQYVGPPIEFGRMEPTSSDPSVQQQFGMTIGIPNAGQVNALGTINIRGERSVTCKGDFDKAPSTGPLPAGAVVVSLTRWASSDQVQVPGWVRDCVGVDGKRHARCSRPVMSPRRSSA